MKENNAKSPSSTKKKKKNPDKDKTTPEKHYKI